MTFTTIELAGIIDGVSHDWLESHFCLNGVIIPADYDIKCRDSRVGRQFWSNVKRSNQGETDQVSGYNTTAADCTDYTLPTFLLQTSLL